MRPSTLLAIPQPCHESWAAMMPTATGRHCTACQKTVVDFTLKSDAEILAYLARAAGTRTCGRFAAGQLERPLQRAALAAPTGRWRAWLAAVVAVWGVREVAAVSAQAQSPTEWRARYWGGPVPAAPAHKTPEPNAAEPSSAATAPPATTVETKIPDAPLIIRGMVRDSAAHMGLPGVTVLLKNSQIGTSTNVDGNFELTVPPQYVTAGTVAVQLSSVGYMSQLHTLAVGSSASANRFFMKEDTMRLGEVVFIGYSKMPPTPWHPRAFYYWGKYWVTRPFRR